MVLYFSPVIGYDARINPSSREKSARQPDEILIKK